MNATLDGAGNLRIGFFLRHEYHRPMLEPLARLLYQQGHAVRVSHQRWKLILFNPHVLVAAESLRKLGFRGYLPYTKRVHTLHGLASKGSAARSASFSHYTCVTSHAMRDWYVNQGIRPRRDFWITGYPQMDPLFRDDPPKLPFDLPRGSRVILYAPSFQRGFTSIHMLGTSAIELLAAGRKDTFVIIKPHPRIAESHPEWLAGMRSAAARKHNAVVVENADSDLTPYLKAADVLVSDVSSPMLEYLALDRPIVLLTNPSHQSEKGYDPNGFEWSMRDAAEEIDEPFHLPATIRRAITDPSSRSIRRRRYRRILFGDLTDGRSTERICRLINNLQFETAGKARMAVRARLNRAVHLVF